MCSQSLVCARVSVVFQSVTCYTFSPAKDKKKAKKKKKKSHLGSCGVHQKTCTEDRRPETTVSMSFFAALVDSRRPRQDNSVPGPSLFRRLLRVHFSRFVPVLRGQTTEAIFVDVRGRGRLHGPEHAGVPRLHAFWNGAHHFLHSCVVCVAPRAFRPRDPSVFGKTWTTCSSSAD